MKKKMQLTQREFDQFEDYLRHDEREESTIEAYLRSLTRFAEWADGRAVTKELAMEWKSALSESGYRPISVNAMLAAVNKFFTCMGREDCKVKYLKLQRQMFRKSEKDLSKEEYQRLVQAAHEKGDLRMELILETICATGIRVGEVRYITVEAARRGRADIALKGKLRTILLPARLCRRLLKFAGKNKIAFGAIFLTKSGRPLSRTQIWAEMKCLCAKAGVAAEKVFPHNLRHLFARTFYESCRDVVKLADILGHSSVETTRLYLLTTGAEHLRQLERLRLLC